MKANPYIELNLEFHHTNLSMSSWKRYREVESDEESDIATLTTKRTRLDGADPSDPTCHRTEHSDMVREYLLITWSQPMAEHQKSFLIKKMEELVTLKSAADFLEPRTGEHIPLYVNKIKGPTDISTIRSLLETGGYPSVTDLLIDFTTMIHNVIWINGCKRHDPAPARRLLRCFCERLKHCPIGPQGKPMSTYTRNDIRRMASEITSVSTKASIPSSEKSEVANIDNSLQDEPLMPSVAREADTFEDAFGNFSIKSDDIVGSSFVDVSDSMFWIRDEPLQISTMEDTKTSEPGDPDKETRQLSKSIKECQQKLAKMIQRKGLLTEIKDLDTEKAAIEKELPEIEKQWEQLGSKVNDYNTMLGTARKEETTAAESRYWHNQESERLQRESERLQRESEKCRRESETHRKESERFSSVGDECKQRMNVLRTEKKLVEIQTDRALLKHGELRDKYDTIQHQRVIAKKKLEELNNGSA